MFSVKIDCYRISTKASNEHQLRRMEVQWFSAAFAWWVLAVLATSCGAWQLVVVSIDGRLEQTGQYLLYFAPLIWLYAMQSLMWWKVLCDHRRQTFFAQLGNRSVDGSRARAAVFLPQMLSSRVYTDMNPTQIGIFNAKQVLVNNRTVRTEESFCLALAVICITSQWDLSEIVRFCWTYTPINCRCSCGCYWPFSQAYKGLPTTPL